MNDTIQLIIGIIIAACVIMAGFYFSSRKKKEIRENARKTVMESRTMQEDQKKIYTAKEEDTVTGQPSVSPAEAAAPVSRADTAPLSQNSETESSGQEKKQEKAQKETTPEKEMYYFLNQLTKKMFYHYRTRTWKELKQVEVSASVASCDPEAIKESLRTEEAQLLDRILECLLFKNETCTVINSDKLKEVFEQMVLPFYPVYYRMFDNDVRYAAFLNKKTLSLFHQLSGKKFRVGYKNRYATGVPAFQWTKDRYQVYRKDGEPVCDAVFREGKVYDGFATETVDYLSQDDWIVEKTGFWRNGSLQNGSIHYRYQKKCK